MKTYGYYNLATQNGFVVEIPNNDDPELEKICNKIIRDFNEICFNQLNQPNNIIINSNYNFKIKYLYNKINFQKFENFEKLPKIYKVHYMKDRQFNNTTNKIQNGYLYSRAL